MEISYCEAQAKRRYVVLHRSTEAAGTTLVLCPPLGQEMVTTYSRLARWSKQLAMRGISVLRYHPFGTGESDGTYADFTLDSAVQDAVTVQNVARQQIRGARIGYLGLRFGATVSILAAAVQPVDFLVLWCPVANLRNYFRDLLRSQVTADAVRRSRTRSTQKMIEDLEAGRSVDVWGYELSSALYRQMAAMQALPDPPPARNILWLVRPADEDAAVPIVERWKGMGSNVDFQVIPETVFWEYPGSTVPEQFAAATVQWLSHIGD
jgi:alpha/beta superfamily hydrolase